MGWRGGGVGHAVVVVRYPCLTCNSVENNFVPFADRRAGARVFSGEFGKHSFLHGFLFMRFVIG